MKYYRFPWWDNRWKIVPLDLTDAEVLLLFTNGHCHSLAKALHKLTGWPYRAYQHDKIWTYSHLVIKTPKGKIIDINGLADPHKLCNDFGEFISNVAMSVFYDKSAYLPICTPLALPFARLLLKKLNLEKEILICGKK